MKKLFALTALATATTILPAEDMVLNDDHTVTVDASSTETISDKVTGPGRIILLGGGTLVLNNSANDFTGGIVVSNGVVRADASGAFGTGPIMLEGTNALRQVQFNAAGGVFANSITLCTTGTANDVVYVMKNATVNGNMTTSPDYCDTKNYFKIRVGETKGEPTHDASGFAQPKTELNGEVNAARFNVVGCGSLLCKQKVTVSNTAQFGYTSDDRGCVYLYDPRNEIAYLLLKAFDVVCKEENVLYNCNVRFSYGWGPNGHGFIILDGFNQQFRYINYSEGNAYTLMRRDGNCCGLKTNNSYPATVTLIGPGSTHGYGRLVGPVSIVVDKAPESETMYQRFVYRKNDMTGTFTLKNGSCYWMNGVEFSNLENLLQTGGTFQFNSVTNCCPKLRKMEVSGGTVEFKNSCKDVFNADLTDLHLSSSAKFYIASGLTNSVNNLYLDGKPMFAGVYTYENLPSMKHDTKSADYAGALIVRRGRYLHLLVR